MKHVKFLAVVMLGGLILAGCKKKNNDEENEEELITTVKVNLTEVGTSNTLSFTWKDVDGPGGNAPQITPVVLGASKAYNCTLEFLDESKTPAEDITKEIKEEDDEHQIYYEVAAASLISVTNLNTDRRGLPLGTTSSWTTGAAGTGTLKITLKHKPGIKAAGDLVTKGETDIEIIFPVTIQ